MIENTYDNRDKLAKLVVDSMSKKSLKHFAENKIWTMLGDEAYFNRRLEALDIKTQDDLNRSFDDDCPVIGGSPLPEDIDE